MKDPRHLIARPYRAGFLHFTSNGGSRLVSGHLHDLSVWSTQDRQQDLTIPLRGSLVLSLTLASETESTVIGSLTDREVALGPSFRA
jgi:hypothetical protein